MMDEKERHEEVESLIEETTRVLKNNVKNVSKCFNPVEYLAGNIRVLFGNRDKYPLEGENVILEISNAWIMFDKCLDTIRKFHEENPLFFIDNNELLDAYEKLASAVDSLAKSVNYIVVTSFAAGYAVAAHETSNRNRANVATKSERRNSNKEIVYNYLKERDFEKTRNTARELMDLLNKDEMQYTDVNAVRRLMNEVLAENTK
ncbi:hypothetical protein [Desulfatiglans anilini]|uniref:hypothetical protein n=1 Tax=Desulfatiglans anilini TaxID=90728 RepID=UPI0012946718|nr:hypothetical protein [Desulfatiglans anilini]